MREPRLRIGSALLCSALVLASSAALCAQGPGGPRGGGMGMPGGGRGMGMPGGGPGMGMPPGGGPGMGRPGGRSNDPAGTPGGNAPSAGNAGGTHGSQLAPAGRWWDDRKYAKSLGLSGEQQKRMDSVFNQNRDTLVSRFDTLQKAQARLDTLRRADHPDESAVFAEIDHVAQARAELEQAYTHMQLQIRGELTAEQISKLDDKR